MPLLHFFLAKLIRRNGKSSAQLSLRFKQGGSTGKDDELSASEPVLSAFCFPLGTEAVAPKEILASEEYSFTLTHGDGTRFHGFCRVVLPPAPKLGSKLRYPWVLCIMSEFPWNAFYFLVLQTMEQLLRVDEALDTDQAQLPPSSMAGTFLEDLGFQLSPDPAPGSIIKVPLPNAAGMLSASPILTLRNHGPSLYKDDWIQLPVPADCGNGKLNCGISLARLLWHVPVSSMLTLLSAMLLERRIIMTSRSRDTLTAAVQAAAALLYPFKFHHIFLPLLPKMLKDYLQAPMPFMVGLPDQMLGILRSMQDMDEVTMVDLDQGKVYPNWTPGSPVPSPSAHDDSTLLPWREELEAALTAAYSTLKSPTEYEQSSPFIAGIMQEYFLKLLGSYRSFIHEDTPVLNAYFATHFQAGSSGSATAAAAQASPASKRESRRSSRVDQPDSGIKGHGYVLEQQAFVAHHRRNETARTFLSKFRHSQMYEMFVQERLQMAAQGYVTDDPFEARLVLFQERRLAAAMKLGPRPAPPPSGKLAGMFRKHHRSGSADVLPDASSSDAIMRRITTEPELQGRQPSPASFFEGDLDLDFLDTALDLKVCPDSPDMLHTGSPNLYKSSAPQSAPMSAGRQVGQPLVQVVSVQTPHAAFVRGVSAPLDQLDSLSAGSAAHTAGDSMAASHAINIEQRPATNVQQPLPQQQPVAHQQAAAQQRPVTQQSPAAAASSSSAAPVPPHQRQGAVSLGLQSGMQQLQATRDAVKEMWSTATLGMRRSVGGGTAAGPERRRTSMSGAGDDKALEGGMLPCAPPSSSAPLDCAQPKSVKAAGSEAAKPRGSLLQRYLPHGAVGVGAGVVQSLLEGSKLRQPPAPVRPLNVAKPPPVTEQGQGQQETSAQQPPVWDPFGVSFR